MSAAFICLKWEFQPPTFGNKDSDHLFKCEHSGNNPVQEKNPHKKVSPTKCSFFKVKKWLLFRKMLHVTV